MVRSPEADAVGAPVPSLVCHGVSPDADLAYRHLAGFGPGTAVALERDLGMSRSRVAAALDELTAVGAIAVRPLPTARTTAWTARPSAEVVKALRRSPAKRATGGPSVDAGEAIRQAMGSGPLLLGDDLRHLPSRSATRARLSRLVTVARHEHLAMHPERAFDAETLRRAGPMDRTLLDRGVRMRVLGVQPDPDTPANHGSPAPAASPDYRVASALPVKLLIIDRKIALFPVAPDNLERGYLEVAQAPIVSALVALFERHWEPAEDPRECPVPQIMLSPRERALVALLAQGHTDATAARELRISTRSISNMLRTLMERLGVENRFQLGLALGAAHTVPAPSSPSSAAPAAASSRPIEEEQ